METRDTKKDLLFLDPSEHAESPFLVESDKQDTISKIKPKFEKLPPSSVLSRVRDFLPQLADANKKLEDDIKKNTDVSIESVDETKPYIKMKLALGVLEEQAGVTEQNINIPSSNGQGKRPVIEIIQGGNSSSDSESGSESDSESRSGSDVEMVENEEKSAT